MTGRRLYDRYCDATAKNFQGNRGGRSSNADHPLPAWPSLSDHARRRWSDLAKAITPKRRSS